MFVYVTVKLQKSDNVHITPGNVNTTLAYEHLFSILTE